MSPNLPHIQVTCAIIQRGEEILAVRRGIDMSMPLKWEFAGGKMEPNESSAESIVREIQEELDVQIGIHASLPTTTWAYPTIIVTLIPFVCTIRSGTLLLREHDDYIWGLPEDLLTLDWAAADVPVLQSYIAYANRHL